MKIPTTLGFLLTLATSWLAQHCTGQEQASSKQSSGIVADAEDLAIAVQKICPVSGADLGSMGEPVKVRVGEQIAYLCCQGCQDKKLSAEHWKTIQTRLATAQGICPIMEKPVDSSMKSTVVNGQQIFVCCPPCIPKIQADPKTSIDKIVASYTKFIAAEKQADSDQIHVKAQRICPVSGKELGSMGEPIKVKVGKEEHAFLCCKGCVGQKLDANHWRTIQANLAKAQGTCPIMGKPIDATMKSTIVNGRRIFVCCPPCIEKIDADPAGFVLKLDKQIIDGQQNRESELQGSSNKDSK